MIGMLVLAAQLSTNIFVPRFGPKVMVPIGMVLGAAGMLYLTRLGLDSTYAANVLPPLMILGFGMGTIMPAAIQTATLGVDREFAGVASALVNTSQQVGGSIGTALLNTLAATAATGYLASHVAAERDRRGRGGGAQLLGGVPVGGRGLRARRDHRRPAVQAPRRAGAGRDARTTRRRLENVPVAVH